MKIPAGVGSYTYASLIFDCQIGFESIDRDAGDTADRVFVSAGLHHRQSRLKSSIEGHIGLELMFLMRKKSRQIIQILSI